MKPRATLPERGTKRVYKLASLPGTRRSLADPTLGWRHRRANLKPQSEATPTEEPRFATRPLSREVASLIGTPTATISTTRELNPGRLRKRSTTRKVLLWLGLALGVGLLGYIAWVVAAYLHFLDSTYVPIHPTKTPNPIVVQSTASAISAAGITVTPTEDPYKDLPSGHIYILLLGSDKRPDEQGLSPRSDTLILANLDTQTRTVKMLTIPRDLAVEIPGYSGKYKINAAYFLGERDDGPGGGQSLAVETVSRVFNVPIDYYVMINFEGFRTLVDTLGGVDIDVPTELDDPNYPSDDPNDPFAKIHIHFDAGLQHMDGLQALRYARTRHADSDFGRSRRQLQIIMALKHKATSLDLLPKLPGVLDQLAGMIETNIPPEKQIPLLQAGYDLDPSHILTTTIGADLVTPVILPDRSEALNLNVKKAKPVLDAFFGRTPSPTPTRTPRRRTPTVTPTRIPSKTPTPRRTALTPQATPSGTRFTVPRTPTIIRR